VDGRLARGAQSRRAVLARATDIASVEGLDDVTIGRLATELGLSKSGIFTLFGSKEDLQLAAVDYAAQVFRDRVITPAFAEPRGAPRLGALLRNWLAYSRTRVFPGGCFFAAVAAEFGSRRGRVHDKVVANQADWAALVERLVAEAVEAGHLPAGTDVRLLAFEFDAVCRAANSQSLRTSSDDAYDLALRSISSRLS
jgi:AcrR family transcriptional regulator